MVCELSWHISAWNQFLYLGKSGKIRFKKYDEIIDKQKKLCTKKWGEKNPANNFSAPHAWMTSQFVGYCPKKSSHGALLKHWCNKPAGWTYKNVDLNIRNPAKSWKQKNLLGLIKIDERLLLKNAKGRLKKFTPWKKGQRLFSLLLLLCCHRKSEMYFLSFCSEIKFGLAWHS